MPHPHNPITLSEKFFAWGYRTKFFRQFVALAITGVGAYALFPLWWETSQAWYLMPACICLVLALVFGFLVLWNLIEAAVTCLGHWKLCAAFVAANLYAEFRVSSPVRLYDPMLWAAIICGGAAALIAIDAVTFPKNTFNFKNVEAANQT